MHSQAVVISVLAALVVALAVSEVAVAEELFEADASVVVLSGASLVLLLPLLLPLRA